MRGPYTQDMRGVRTSYESYPDDVLSHRSSEEPHSKDMASRLSGKPPTFYGTDAENFSIWIYKIELHFYNNCIPAEDYFTNMFVFLGGDVDAFAYELVLANGGKGLT